MPAQLPSRKTETVTPVIPATKAKRKGKGKGKAEVPILDLIPAPVLAVPVDAPNLVPVDAPPLRSAPQCPSCGSSFSSVYYVRPGFGGSNIRRRECQHCGRMFSTVEK